MGGFEVDFSEDISADLVKVSLSLYLSLFRTARPKLDADSHHDTRSAKELTRMRSENLPRRPPRMC